MLWPKMLYNYPQGEDRVASSGLGTHSLRESEIAGAPPPDWRGLPEGVKRYHICKFELLLISPSHDLAIKLSERQTCAFDAASGS